VDIDLGSLWPKMSLTTLVGAAISICRQANEYSKS
jgi:hypothetical protein